MVAPALLLAIRAGIPAAKLIAKYGKKAYNAAKKLKVVKKNTVSTNLTSKQKTFLQKFRSEAKGDGVTYSIRGKKITMKKNAIDDFDDFFNIPKPKDAFGERIPTGLTAIWKKSSIIKKLK